jgi:hypothetical protein
MPAIYRIGQKGYLLHAERKSISGFRLAWKPFISISEKDFNANVIANAIKEVLIESQNTKRVADPKNWLENDKQFLIESGLKTLKELNSIATKHCGIDKENSNIIFTPTKQAEKPDEGFLHKGKEDAVSISETASNDEIIEALNLAFSKCE